MDEIAKIAVDEKRLAEAFGLTEWPADVVLHGWKTRMAARAITDSLPYKLDTAAERLSNAEAWINYAYKAGIEWGKQSERAHWQSKIRSLFGLDS